MSIPAMIVFHFDSALELMTDGMEHELFDKDEMSSLLRGALNSLSMQHMSICGGLLKEYSVRMWGVMLLGSHQN